MCRLSLCWSVLLALRVEDERKLLRPILNNLESKNKNIQSFYLSSVIVIFSRFHNTELY